MWHQTRRWIPVCGPLRFDHFQSFCQRASSSIALPLPNCSCEAPVCEACALPEEDSDRPKLFTQCMVCGIRHASVAEFPCGHLNACKECHQGYRLNPRCLRCQGCVPFRLDLSAFLDEVT